MVLHQIQVTYQPEEDRLLYLTSFSAEDGSMQEIRAWLTRRIVKNLWPGIVKALETQITLETPQASHAAAEIIGMAHQASISGIINQGNLNLPYEVAAQGYPVGETPILVNAIRFTITANQPIRIGFTPATGDGFEVALEQTALHGLCTLLQEAVNAAEWDIELLLPGADMNEDVPAMLN